METNLWSAIAASGIPALAYVIGNRTATGVTSRLDAMPLARASLALTVGVAILTPLLITVAAFGWFDSSVIGVLAWCLVVPTIVRRIRAARTPFRPDIAELAASVAVALFVVVAIHGRDETLGMGRDQQIYAEFAVALARRGAPEVTYPTADAADEALLRNGYSRAACHADFLDRWSVARLTATPFVVPGGTNACNGVDDPIVLLHPWGWPIWLSIAYRMFGVDGLYAANAVIFALGAMLLFATARLFVGRGAAVVATLILLSVPSALWIAGLSLSEPLAMALMLAVPLLAAGDNRDRDWLIAAATLAAILVRIDAVVLVPVVIAAALASAIDDPEVIAASRRVAVRQFAALAIAAGFYAAAFPSYLDAFWTPFLVLFAISFALLAASFAVTPVAAQHVCRVLCSARMRVAAIALVLALFVYAATIRPYFGLRPGAPAATSDFREFSLLNLAANLSWPVLLAALAGILVTIWKGWQVQPRLHQSLVLFLALGSSVALLAFPAVSPDQPWGFRRFVPTVVPYAALFAAVLLQSMRSHPARWVSQGAFAATTATVIAFVVALPRAAALLRENDGYTRQLDSIASALPRDLTVATGELRDISSALLVAYDKPVATANDGLSAGGDDRALREWIADKAAAGNHPWFLHGAAFRATGLKLSAERSWTLRRQFVAPRPRAPATTVLAERQTVTLSRVDGLDPRFAARMFGAERAWGSEEGGFFATEIAGFGMFRYTNGKAWIDVPAESLRDCEALKVDLYTYARKMARRGVSVTLDGRVAWTGSVATGISTLRVPIDRPPEGATVRIGILSEAADPADLSGDDPRRNLGAGLIGIRPLRSGEPRESGPSMSDFRAVISVAGTIPEPVIVSPGSDAGLTLDVTNAGTAYWPAYREHEAPAGVVKLALQWFDRANPSVPVLDDRWPLSISMLGGDRMRLRVPLAASRLDGKRLPPGLYELRIGMVREGFALFADAASRPLSLAIRVSGASAK